MKEHKFSLDSFIGGWYISDSICDDLINYFDNNSKLVNSAEDILEGADMIDPIQVKKYTKSKTPRYGAGGKIYREREYGVWKGNQRVTAAKKLGYTHIEGIIV